MIPKNISQFYFDFDWDNRKVWALKASEDLVPISALEWQLAFHFWSSVPPKPLFDLRPMDVIQNPKVSIVHSHRIENADLNFALDVMNYKGRLILLDGFHRLAKLKMQNSEQVRVRVHDESVIPLILRS